MNGSKQPTDPEREGGCGFDRLLSAVRLVMLDCSDARFVVNGDLIDPLGELLDLL